MKKLMSLAVVVLVAFGLAGCGSVSTADTFDESAEVFKTTNNAGTQNIEPAKDSGIITVKVGETITIPIVIEMTEAFVGFQMGIGFDKDSVEIVSTSLTVGEGSYSGMFVSNLEFQPSPKDVLLREFWQENVDAGMNKTVLTAGVAATQFSGKVTLCAVTVKGISAGKANLNPRLMALINGDSKELDLPQIKAVQVLVVE
jgi:hypothetical protein